MTSKLIVTSLVVLVVISMILVQETEGTKYCKTALVNKIYNTCRTKWFSRKKREAGLLSSYLDDVELIDTEAKAFLAAQSRAHSRVKRGWASSSPGMQEECCKEGCATEEVKEIC